MQKHVVLISLILAVVITGCSGGEKPSGISDAHYNYGLKALEIIDNYLDFDGTSNNSCKRLDVLVGEKDSLPETDFNHPNHAKNFTVESTVTLLSYELLSIDIGSGSYEDILDKRNELAELLGEKER